MTDMMLSILMIAGAALLAGGIYLLRTKKNPKQGWLMLVAAAVMFANVGIWSIPVPEANTPVDKNAPE